MRRLGGVRVFADHYQFYVSDRGADLFSAALQWTPETSELGYCADDSAIYVGTSADLNDHWVEVFVSEVEPDLGEAERVVLLPLSLNFGFTVVVDHTGRRCVVRR